MGRQSESLGVGAIISVYAKSLDRRWAKTKFPLTWQKEKLHNLAVLTFVPPLRVGEKAHTIELQYDGRTWKLKGTQVTVTTAAPCQSSSSGGSNEGSSAQVPVTVLGPLPDVCEEDIELTLSDEDDSNENDPHCYISQLYNHH